MTYIENLIFRMSDNSVMSGESLPKGVLYDSSKSVSGNAFEEARNINNLEYLEELKSLILSEKDNNKKCNLVFVIGHLANNTGKNEIANFLIDQLKSEKDKSTIISILIRLEEIYKDKNVDLTAIYKLCDNKNWNIRSSAFSALLNTEHKVEDFLLSKLASTENKDDILYLLRALTKIGTNKTLNIIDTCLKNRSRNIKESAQTATAIIMLREGFSNLEIQKRTKFKETIIETFRNKLDKYTVPG